MKTPRKRTTVRGRLAAAAAALVIAQASATAAHAADPITATAPDNRSQENTTADPDPPKDPKWGEWQPADRAAPGAGPNAGDMRFGLHAQHISLADSRVGGGHRGRDYGFRRPLVYTLEIAFTAFTSKNFSAGLVLQPAAFGGQDVAPTADGAKPTHTRSPFVLGIGALMEGGFSAGPLLFRPGMATGPRGVMLIQDRSGKQSPPAVAQWFVDLRGTVEIALGRSAAIGVGMSLDVIRPTDWGTYGYLSWRFGDVARASR